MNNQTHSVLTLARKLTRSFVEIGIASPHAHFKEPQVNHVTTPNDEKAVEDTGLHYQST
jgi:hypothetical protein